MKKLLSLLLLLIIVGCDKGSDSDDVLPTDPNKQACIISELLLTQKISSYSAGGAKYKSFYDEKGRLTFIEESYDSKMIRHHEIVYDSEGRVIGKSFLTPSGELEMTISYEYDANNLLIKEAKTNFNASGDKHVSTITYEYTSPTQLKSKTEDWGNGKTYSYETFEYKNGLMTKAVFNLNDGEYIAVTELEYDNKKNPSSTNLALLNNKFLVFGDNSNEIHGFPFQHNITKRVRTNGDNKFTTTSEFSYSDKGYPVAETRKEDFSELVETYNYTYRCK